MALVKSEPGRINPETVNGWGVDADPRNDPTYPQRDRSGQEGPGMSWRRPTLQKARVEVLRSVEHNRLPAVYGTAAPPRGFSGMMRRAAFTYSESDWRHWLMLLGADRINVVEGVVADLVRGHIPNVPAEMGVRAQWRHDRAGLIRKVAIATAVSVAAVALIRRRHRRDW